MWMNSGGTKSMNTDEDEDMQKSGEENARSCVFVCVCMCCMFNISSKDHL